MGDHGVEAASEEKVEDLVSRRRNAFLSQELGQATAGEELAVDKHAVAIEDDQPEAAHLPARA